SQRWHWGQQSSISRPGSSGWPRRSRSGTSLGFAVGDTAEGDAMGGVGTTPAPPGKFMVHLTGRPGPRLRFGGPGRHAHTASEWTGPFSLEVVSGVHDHGAPVLVRQLHRRLAFVLSRRLTVADQPDEIADQISQAVASLVAVRVLATPSVDAIAELLGAVRQPGSHKHAANVLRQLIVGGHPLPRLVGWRGGHAGSRARGVSQSAQATASAWVANRSHAVMQSSPSVTVTCHPVPDHQM